MTENKIDLRKLIEAGVHFGHQTWRWCPKMKPYIWGEKNSIHLIDVSKTARQMEKAGHFLRDIASKGKPILWVCTKEAGKGIVEKRALELTNPYVTGHWVGGTLTNFPQVKKSVTKLLHYEDILAKAQEHLYTKRELGHFQKMIQRYRRNVGGIVKLSWPIGAIVVVDVRKEHTAVREAVTAGIPIVGIVDTNSDPSHIDYVVPANDDIRRSIEIIINYLADEARQGYAVAATRPQEEVAAGGGLEEMLHNALGPDEDEERKRRSPSRRGRAGGGRSPRRPGQRTQQRSTERAPGKSAPREPQAEGAQVGQHEQAQAVQPGLPVSESTVAAQPSPEEPRSSKPRSEKPRSEKPPREKVVPEQSAPEVSQEKISQAPQEK
jgi:small subunit ribosomal protein S2